MRKFTSFCCVVGAMACGGRGADSKHVSAGPDTMTVAQPAAVTPAQPQRDKPVTPVAPRPKAAGLTPVPPAAADRVDTVRGIVSVVGTDNDRHVTIARPGGGKRIEVTGPMAGLIGRVGGANVSVWGVSSGNAIEAARFIVNTVDGMLALDGVLKTEGAALYLVMTDGRRTRIVSPPPPLMGRDGARVWITGDPSRGVAAFGFIDPAG